MGWTMNSKLKALIFTLLIITNYTLLFPLQVVYGDETTQQQEIDIATSPHKIFFNLSNLKPGDRATKILTVFNKGKQDFDYIFSNRFLTGSEKFYNALLLNVSDQKGELFSGKLKDFEKLDARFLSSGTSEQLTFTIEIPYELGNEYQGLGSEFQFKFYVEGTLGGVLPPDGPKLPNTATDIFNLLAAGSILTTIGATLFFIQKRRKQDIKLN
jgi:LPXTG-motif cell wall-anchored protein